MGQSSAVANSDLDSLKTVIDIIDSVVTGATLIIDGIWAYFKFIKGRTFRPRLEVNMFGQWRTVGQKQLLHARIRVKNIGSSNVKLRQQVLASELVSSAQGSHRRLGRLHGIAGEYL
jgi:hypothetical protein